MVNIVVPREVVATVTASGVLVAGTHTPVNASSGNKTLTLPTSVTAGAHLSVEKADASANTVTVSGSIRGGASTIVLSGQYESVELIANTDGTSWYPVANNLPSAAYAPLAPWSAISHGKIKGGNIVPKPDPTNGGASQGVGAMWAEWDWNNWIKPQIDRAIALRLNAIRIIGSPQSVLTYASTSLPQISQAAYNARWRQIAEYCLRNGLYLYPTLTEKWAFMWTSFHGLGGTAPWNFQEPVATAVITSSAAALAKYPNIVGFDLFQEGSGSHGDGLVLADVLALYSAIRAVAPGIPLTTSDSSGSYGSADAFWTNTTSLPYQAWTSQGGADFVDLHIYTEGVNATQLDGYIKRVGRPIIIGEYGGGQNLSSASRAARYQSARVLHNRPGVLGSLLWALADQGTAPSSQFGVWDNTGFSQPAYPSPNGSTPLSVTTGRRSDVVTVLEGFASTEIPAPLEARPNAKNMVFLGTSWTEGNQDGTGTRYPALVGTALPWATVTNLGKTSWTSTEVAMRWGAPVTLDAFTLPASTTPAAVSILSPSGAYRTGSATQFAWTGELRDRASDAVYASGVVLRHDASGAALSGWTIERGTAGSSVAIPAGAVFVCTEFESMKDATLVIEVGRNNFTDPAVVIRDINAIRAAHGTSSAPFLVLAVPTASGETVGTVPYSRIKRLNHALRAAFPNEFVDIRRYLIDRGLVVTGTPAVASDVDQVIADTIPQSLLVGPTYDHPNATGYKAIAAAVLDGLSRVGAMVGPSSGVSGVTTTALGPMVWDATDVPDALGSPVNNVLDRTGYTILQAAATSAAPILSYDAGSGRRYLRFDGVDDRMYGLTGDIGQAFTIVAKVRFRDLSTFAQGVFWSYDSPGAAFSVSTTGRVVLNSGTAVQTATGVVAQGATVTIAGVANGASSAAGVAGAALTTGDAGTRGVLTQIVVGFSFDTAARFAAIDLFQLRVFPWALTEAQVTAVAAQVA